MRPFPIVVAALAFAHLSSACAHDAGLCARWKEPEEIGRLDTALVPEASGLAVSLGQPGRLYHVNDSGDDGYFYYTDEYGRGTRKVEIDGFKPADAEDLAYGRCDRDRHCLFIGDIGDNAEKRDHVRIALVVEQKQFPAKVSPLKTLKLRYPDRPHNAEGLAFHPSGDLYILTKEFTERTLEIRPAQIFRLRRAAWESVGPEQALTLEHVAELDLPYLAEGDSFLPGVVTSFDISSDGSTFLALTYDRAFEFAFDLGKGLPKPARAMVVGQDFRAIGLKMLAQQESIAYLPGRRSFLYGTEARLGSSPLMKVDCAE